MINNCEKRILYWGLPHVVFLAIASITALQVSYDFSDDSFVKVTVFIISFILLSFSYIIVQNMIYYLFTIICSIWKRNNKSLSSNLMTKQSPSKTVFQFISQENIQKANDAKAKLTKKEREEKLKIFIEYTIKKMSSHMDSVNFEKLCNNIRLYIQNEKPITMEPVVTNGELNSLDLRHFGWNIGTRLGYKGDSKAYFIKNVFQEELKHLSLSTLQQTLRQDGKCSIKINIPKADSFQFKED